MYVNKDMSEIDQVLPFLSSETNSFLSPYGLATFLTAVGGVIFGVLKVLQLRKHRDDPEDIEIKTLEKEIKSMYEMTKEQNKKMEDIIIKQNDIERDLHTHMETSKIYIKNILALNDRVNKIGENIARLQGLRYYKQPFNSSENGDNSE